MANKNSNSVLHLNFQKGVLSLSLDNGELFHQEIALPSQIVLSLEGASGLSASCSSSSMNGIQKSSCIVTCDQKIRF
jgi:hypothetical protein